MQSCELVKHSAWLHLKAHWTVSPSHPQPTKVMRTNSIVDLSLMQLSNLLLVAFIHLSRRHGIQDPTSHGEAIGKHQLVAAINNFMVATVRNLTVRSRTMLLVADAGSFSLSLKKKNERWKHSRLTSTRSRQFVMCTAVPKELYRTPTIYPHVCRTTTTSSLPQQHFISLDLSVRVSLPFEVSEHSH